MSASHSSTTLAGFVAEAPAKLDVGVRRRMAGAQTLRDSLEQTAANENGLRRRARRQGLAMMIASSLLSLAVIYGFWTLLSAVL